jgi:hypothetical protein
MNGVTAVEFDGFGYGVDAASNVMRLHEPTLVAIFAIR